MAKILQQRRGTRSEHTSFDGAPGEITVITDTGTETAVVHTTGGAGTGVELARNDKVVHKDLAESITGVKTFTASPIVPTPTAATQAASKGYIDDNVRTKTDKMNVSAITSMVVNADGTITITV